ncbi:hypothetical protein KC19_10G037900 [Ceratodon purpureus]|uniref:Uncharacterized protein n=1 Tax=Ceratodon purpureus TaxID=3225 RepID=A0A8T0GNF8_CERPU|nr:hypothetical protein KC19_10G037900 [Ceratodon purpureus]
MGRGACEHVSSHGEDELRRGRGRGSQRGVHVGPHGWGGGASMMGGVEERRGEGCAIGVTEGILQCSGVECRWRWWGGAWCGVFGGAVAAAPPRRGPCASGAIAVPRNPNPNIYEFGGFGRWVCRGGVDGSRGGPTWRGESEVAGGGGVGPGGRVGWNWHALGQ